MEFVKEPVDKITFTNHILERYVERTMGKTGNELKQFVVQNSEQIKDKILKMYEYSELFWYGKIKDHDFTYFTINRDGWVMVIDKNKTTLVTIYQVDLGLGVDFNKQYIAELKKFVENELNEIEKLKLENEFLSEEDKKEIDELKETNKMLQAQIEYNNKQIQIYEQNRNLRQEEISLRDKKLHKKIEGFIGAKIF